MGDFTDHLFGKLGIANGFFWAANHYPLTYKAVAVPLLVIYRFARRASSRTDNFLEQGTSIAQYCSLAILSLIPLKPCGLVEAAVYGNAANRTTERSPLNFTPPE